MEAPTARERVISILGIMNTDVVYLYYAPDQAISHLYLVLDIKEHWIKMMSCFADIIVHVAYMIENRKILCKVWSIFQLFYFRLNICMYNSI